MAENQVEPEETIPEPEETIPEPEETVPEPEEAVQEHGDEFRKLWELMGTHGKPIAIALGIALVAITGLKLYRSHVRKSRQEASRLFGQARSAQDLESLMSRYPSVPTAPLTAIRLAKGRYDQADYQAALAKYEDFRSRYADHPLAIAAEMGRLHCLEALGSTEEALQGFKNFAAQNPQHYLWAQAIMGEGRCLEQVGRVGEARTLYEDFVADNSDSAWKPQVEESLELLNQKAAAPPPPETPAVGAAPAVSVSGLDTNVTQVAPISLMPIDFAPAPVKSQATK